MDVKERFLKRFAAAKAEWEDFRADFKDVYRFAFPGGRSLFIEDGDRAKTGAVYDGTLATAINRRVKKTHSSLFPPFKEFVDFNPSDRELADGNPDAWSELYDAARRKTHLAIMRSNFHIEIDKALGDGFCVFGAVALRKGTEDCPFVFEAVHPACVYPGREFGGVVREVFREQMIAGDEIADYWDEAKLPDGVADKTDKVNVKDGWLFDVKTGKYTYAVVIGDDVVFRRENLENSELHVFRTASKTGSAVGYSDALRVLPEIRSADETRYLLLSKARFDLFGIWCAEEESVLNVDDLNRVEPGAWIFVARGAQPPRPLYSGANFDLSQMVLNELHAQIKEGVEGPSLPAENSGSRRSAYEYQLRQGEIESVEMPGYLQILLELQPLFEQMIDILTDPDMAGSPYYIKLPEVDGKKRKEKLSICPISPLIREQDKADNQAALQAYSVANEIDPALVAQIVDKPKYLRKFLDDGGFPSDCMRSEAAARAVEQAQRQAVERETQAAAPAETDPEAMRQAAQVTLPQEALI